MGLRSGRPRLDRRRETWAREAAPAAGRVRVPVRLLERDPGQRLHDAPGRRGRGRDRSAIEDGLHMLIAGGNADLTKGTKDERHRRYLETLRLAPELIEPEVLDRAELVSEITVAPESLMRGFFRRPTGPGWALLATPVTSSTPPRRRESTTRSSRRSTSPTALHRRRVARRIRGLARHARRRALRLVLRLGALPRAGDLRTIVQGLGLRARCGPGPARHLQSPGGAI